jgi:hypothetical protein
MKVATIEKTAAPGRKAGQKIRTVRAGTRRGEPARLQPAADQQVAEIERTFSLRWEW